MTVQDAAQMKKNIATIKEKRKTGELSVEGYYKELLLVLRDLTDSLIDELDKIEAADVRSQIPLLLVILDDQIQASGERE